MSAQTPRYREEREVYIERRQSESPNRYAYAPVSPRARPSVPAFQPVTWEERGRSSISSRSSSQRPSLREQMVPFENQIRAHSIDGRRRSSSRHPSVSSRGSFGPATPTYEGDDDFFRRRRSSSRKPSRTASVVSHPCEENPDFTAADEELRAKKARNKQLLYNGLAVITTIAATNNVYQSTKAHKARKEAVRSGEMTRDEASSAKKKAVAMDLVSVGVGAICVNNAVNGWKKTKSMANEEGTRKAQWDHHVREERRRSMIGY